ncbi:MAG: DUF1846 domain-containing protein [Oscillospiraceae bacterium]|nr:DUF1846 domain-containing protein [Oscillospiraceae bacterium]
MKKKQMAFDNAQYLKMQSEHIRERIAQFGGRLYLEFGGKLYDDYHASRVLPGFQPDSKLRMLLQLKKEVEIVIAINASDIEQNRIRADLGITYDNDVLRLIGLFRGRGLYVGSVVMTQFTGEPAAVKFQKRLEALGIPVYRHYKIDGYPSNLPLILSEDGFGKNEYIEVKRQLVVVTAPGPGSGKMAVCLSQIYQEHQLGKESGYAKFETFPIWNLPLKHPVNVAYEAATADLNDINMIDPFHLEAYGKTAVNYNRDVEVFPVLHAMFERIYGVSPYQSPTDMGVNMAGCCVVDDEAAKNASRQEIIRRYFKECCDLREGKSDADTVYKLQLLMQQMNLTEEERPVIAKAREMAETSGEPAAALQLPNGKIVTGKTTELMGPCSSVLLNALKALGRINDDIMLLSPMVISPIQQLKTTHLGNENPRLHTDETLITLSISAATNPTAERAMNQLSKLRGCEMHSTVMLTQADERTLKRLGVNITCDAQFQSNRLYQK